MNSSDSGVSQHDDRSRDVLDSLRDRIATQKIPPGSPLREQAIADEFGVPRTRVREVFTMLEAKGLIERVPNRGAVVARLDVVLATINDLEAQVLSAMNEEDPFNSSFSDQGSPGGPLVVGPGGVSPLRGGRGLAAASSPRSAARRRAGHTFVAPAHSAAAGAGVRGGESEDIARSLEATLSQLELQRFSQQGGRGAGGATTSDSARHVEEGAEGHYRRLLLKARNLTVQENGQRAAVQDLQER